MDWNPSTQAAAELAEPRECVLESVDGAERVEFVDREPELLVALPLRHRLEGREAHPNGAHRVVAARDGCDMVYSIPMLASTAYFASPMPICMTAGYLLNTC
jgi:hypothetical protein